MSDVNHNVHTPPKNLTMSWRLSEKDRERLDWLALQDECGRSDVLRRLVKTEWQKRHDASAAQ